MPQNVGLMFLIAALVVTIIVIVDGDDDDFDDGDNDKERTMNVMVNDIIQRKGSCNAR